MLKKVRKKEIVCVHGEDRDRERVCIKERERSSVGFLFVKWK